MRILLFIMLLPILSYCQDIKEKKDQILIDGVAVAKVEKIGSDFVYTSLNNANTITVTHNYLKINDNVSKEWLIVSDGSRKTEVVMDYLSFSMNKKKAIAELLSKKYKIITVNGVENLDDFFKEERPSLTEENNKLLSGSIASSKIQNEKLKDLNVNIDVNTKTIYKGSIPYKSDGTLDVDKAKEKKIGFYVVKLKDNSSFTQVVVYDLDNNKLAITESNMFTEISVVFPVQSGLYKYRPSVRFPETNNKYPKEEAVFIKELVEVMYVHDVALGHATKDQKNLVNEAKFENAKANSINIYNKNGFVIDEDGKKHEGVISCMLEKLPVNDPNSKEWGTMVSLDGENIGKEVSILTVNEKGKKRFYNYKSKDGVSFSIANDDGSFTNYKGLAAKGQLFGISGGAIGISSTDNSKFYKEISINEKMSIYQDITDNRYLIKIPSQKKALLFNINKGKEEKNVKAIIDYIGTCLTENQLIELDYTNVDNLNNLVELYSNCSN